MELKELKIAFLKSNWPNTEKLLAEIVQLPFDSSKEIFFEGLKARQHGIRTASIKGLVSYKKEEVADIIRPFLADPSYETRMEAKTAIKELTGEDVKTSRGE